MPPTAREIGARDSQRRSSGQEADPPSSLRCRAPFQSETALPEANSFPSECQPFCNIGAGFHRIARGPRWRVGQQLNIGVMPRVQEAKFDPANAAAYPRLVARKSAIRLRSAQYAAGPAPVTSETQSLQGFVRAIVFHPVSDRAGRRCQMQRGESRGKGQADLPAEQPAPCPRARLPAADAHPGGSRDRVRPASQGPPIAHRLIPVSV